MSFFESNISVMKKTFPGFNDSYLVDMEQLNEKYEIVNTRTGSKTFYIKTNESKILAHSKYNPEKEAVDFLESGKVKYQDENYILLIGFGFGYAAREILKNMSEKNRLIIVEPGWEIFSLALHNIDMKEFFADSRILFLIAEDIDYFKYKISEKITYENFVDFKMLVTPSYKAVFKEEIIKISNMTLDIVKDYKSRLATLYNLSEKWSVTAIAHLTSLLDSYKGSIFYKKFQGVPAIIVAAGPSLNKNIDLLAEVKDKFVIVAVYTALRPLLKKGIIPDFVVSVDSSQTIFEDDEELRMNYDVNLAYLATTDSKLVKRFQGNKVIYRTDHLDSVNSLFGEALKDISSALTSGTVTATAIGVALAMGCDPIIFTGLDLGYTDDRTHVEGTFYDNEKGKTASEKMIKSSKEYVEGINGEKIRTDFLLARYLYNIAEIAEIFERNYIDATEGGAKIANTTIMTLRETIDKYIDKAEKNVTEKINNIIASNKKISSEISKEEVVAKIDEQIKILKQISENMKKSNEIMVMLEKHYLGNKMNDMVVKYIKDLEKLDKKTNALVKKTSFFEAVYAKIRIMMQSHTTGHEKDKQLFFIRNNKILYSETEKMSANMAERLISVKSELEEEILKESKQS